MADRSDASWLTELVAPVPVDEFLANYWLKQHLYCRGARDRFAHLLSWTTLNEILNHHWRETYRFRLACQGRDLTVSSYADLDGFTPRVRAGDVTDTCAAAQRCPSMPSTNCTIRSRDWPARSRRSSGAGPKSTSTRGGAPSTGSICTGTTRRSSSCTWTAASDGSCTAIQWMRSIAAR
jgi:Cupin superfamily protein.